VGTWCSRPLVARGILHFQLLLFSPSDCLLENDLLWYYRDISRTSTCSQPGPTTKSSTHCLSTSAVAHYCPNLPHPLSDSTTVHAACRFWIRQLSRPSSSHHSEQKIPRRKERSNQSLPTAHLILFRSPSSFFCLPSFL
jgi:hypothetical protein